jgi:hypothetical protein
MKTSLHYTDILCATTGVLVSPDGMDGCYRVFDAVAGPGVTTLALTFLFPKVRERLRSAHPEYDKPEVDAAVAKARDEFVAAGASAQSVREAMERHVRPLLPSEFTEVTHMGDENVEAMGADYKAHLGEVLADKEVIVVVAPEERS